MILYLVCKLVTKLDSDHGVVRFANFDGVLPVYRNPEDAEEASDGGRFTVLSIETEQTEADLFAEAENDLPPGFYFPKN